MLSAIRILLSRARIAILVTATLAALGASSYRPIAASAEPSCTGSSITSLTAWTEKVAQQEVWAPSFSSEVCPGGSKPTVSSSSTGSDAGMKEWNYDGKRGAINRGYAFIGTSLAPTTTQIENIESVAGGAQVAVVPVAQTALVVIARPPTGCNFEGLEYMTNTQLASVFEGTTKSWSESEGLETESEKKACESPITRVVRKDASGTAYQFKNYLYQVAKEALPCTEGATEGKATWRELEPISNGETGAPNATWPETCAERTLSSVVRPTGTGDAQVVKKVNATAGSVGFVALPTAEANEAKLILKLQNNGLSKGGLAEFAAPISGKAANCWGASYKTPSGASGGLKVDWSGVFGAHPSIGGESYPLCALMYMITLHGYEAAGFPHGDEPTVHDFLDEYVVQNAGQEAIDSHYYDQLPTGTEEFDVLGDARKAAGKISQ